jgi:hypothetical protein
VLRRSAEGHRVPGTELPGIDYCAIAQSYGVRAVRIASRDELSAADAVRCLGFAFTDRGSHPHRRLRRLGEVASWSGAPLPPGCVAGVDRVSQRPSLHDAHFFESRSNDPTTTGRCNYNYSWPHRRRRSLIRGRRSLAEQIAPLSSRRTLGAAFRIGGSGGMLHVMQTHHLRARCAARKGRRSTRRLARR